LHPYDPIWMIISHPNGLKWLLYKLWLIKMTHFLNGPRVSFQVVRTLLCFFLVDLYYCCKEAGFLAVFNAMDSDIALVGAPCALENLVAFRF